MAGVLVLAGLLARTAFGLWFAPNDMSLTDWTGALWLGLRFDARVALVSVLAAWLLSSLPWLGKYLRPPRARRLWWAYWMIAAGVLAP